MIALHHTRGNFWLRLKLLLTLGSGIAASILVNKPATKPKRRAHRTTAFFEMP